jgi:Tfp pilus assembly protein PilF
VANFRLGNTKAAEKAFESAMKSTPYEVRLLNDYSATLYKMGKVKNAVATLTYALKLDPHFDDAKYNLAAIYFERSMPDSALYYVKSCRDSQKKKDYLGEIYSSYFK